MVDIAPLSVKRVLDQLYRKIPRIVGINFPIAQAEELELTELQVSYQSAPKQLRNIQVNWFKALYRNICLL
jgi:hypothetical protein